MPVKLRFSLEGPPPAGPYQHGSGLRALVLRWLEAADPQLSASVHEANQPKPFAVTPISIGTGQHFFEVSVHVDWIVESLLWGLSETGAEVWLGPQRYRLQAAGEVARATWEQFRTPAPGFRELELELASPTAIHTGKEIRHVVVPPDPAPYFGSWLQRWNLCCPQEMDPGLVELVRERVAVTACRGETERVRLDPKRVFIGFVGRVRFTLLKAEEVLPEVRSELAALARFAAYCGTGVETTRGMGQTRSTVQ